MAIKKKTVKAAPKVEVAEKKVETTPVVEPKQEVKVWTYDELVVLPRDEYLRVEKDIRSGKAKVQID